MIEKDHAYEYTASKKSLRQQLKCNSEWVSMVIAGTDSNTKAETYRDPWVNRLDRHPHFIVNAGTRSFSSDCCAWDCCASDRRPEAQAPGKQLIYLFIPPPSQDRGLKAHMVEEDS